jgi:hypothetical protein
MSTNVLPRAAALAALLFGAAAAAAPPDSPSADANAGSATEAGEVTAGSTEGATGTEVSRGANEPAPTGAVDMGGAASNDVGSAPTGTTTGSTAPDLDDVGDPAIDRGSNAPRDDAAEH